MTTRNPQRHNAVHEAGHAVASWHMQQLLGRGWCQFERVFIRTPEEVAAGPYVDDRGREVSCVGMLEGPSRYNPGILNPLLVSPDLLPLLRKTMEAEVVTTLAGPIAEAQMRKCSLVSTLLIGGSGDEEMARRCLSDFQCDANVSEAFERSVRRTRKIVRQRWGAILALADELLIRRSLTGAEAVAVIDSAVGNEAFPITKDKNTRGASA